MQADAIQPGQSVIIIDDLIATGECTMSCISSHHFPDLSCPGGSAKAAGELVEKQGGKVYVMALISHEDGQVKFYALNTVSKLVSASWR